MARIFLSYARDDEARAKTLADVMDQAGHEVWWDRHIHGGSRFATEIETALKNAEVVVILWSATSVKSAWVQDEAAEGRDRGCLVPISLDESKPPLGFRQYQSIDFSGQNGTPDSASTESLLRAIDQTVGQNDVAKSDGPAVEEPAKPKPSVCVLPFLNMSGDPEQEYFSDGITEDIITDLSKVSALSIVARNTAFNFKGTKVDVQELGRTLKVTHVLEGSVRKSGARVRINAQLIDAAAGDHVWAERYDSELLDIFEIQDEISKAIVSALQLKLLPKEKKAIEGRETNSSEAYNLYLMARQHWISGNDGDSRRDEVVVRICRQATAVDPGYARAWALMSLAQADLRFRHNKEVDGVEAADRALSLDPNIAEAHCVKARYLDAAGHASEAKTRIETALQLNPESWETNKEAARMSFRHGRIDEAIPYFETAAKLMETDYHDTLMLITCYKARGDSEGVRRAAQMTLGRVEKAAAQDPSNGSALGAGACSLAVLGEPDRAREWIERAMLIDPDNLIVRYNLACTLVTYLGDTSGALDLLKPYFEKSGPTEIAHAAADPDMDPIRDDPGFQKMLAEANARFAIADTRQPAK